MELDEMSELLTVASGTDGRKVTELNVGSWFEVIGHLDYDVAREALVLAKRNPTIEYVEPRHILAHAEAVIRHRESEARKLTAGMPVPAEGSAPKPRNFDAMVAAAGDPIAWAREVAIYEQQLRDIGYEDDHTRNGAVDGTKPLRTWRG